MGMKARTLTPLERIRALIGALPETSEKMSHGSPTFWGGKKTFAVYHNGSYDDGQPSIWIKATKEVQDDLVGAAPERFYRPKYLGPGGWVALRLRPDTNWDELAFLLEQGYRMVAAKRALARLEANRDAAANQGI